MTGAWSQRIVRHLPEALAADRLQLAYQPIAMAERPVVTQVEALVRWNDPAFGEVPAAAFVPQARDAGLLAMLDRWVLERGCSDLARWRGERLVPGDLALAVNVAPEQAEEPTFASRVLRTLARHAIPPRNLILEITESGQLTSPDAAAAQLQLLRDEGVRVAIDDFGCDQSLLNFHCLPVDQVKLDRSLVQGLARGSSRAMVRAIEKLASFEALPLVAEGIEQPEDLREALAAGCSMVQGFHIARPLDEEALLLFLTQIEDNRRSQRQPSRRSIRVVDRWVRRCRSPRASSRTGRQSCDAHQVDGSPMP